MKLFNFIQYASQPALIDGDINKILSYQELEDATNLFAKSFDKSKALCFFFINSNMDNLIAYLSLLNQGMAVALFEAGIHPDLKRKLLTLYNPEFIIESLIDSPSHINENSYVIISTSLASLCVRQHNDPTHCTPVHSELQLLLSTSGTTGNPKLIRLSSKNILANARSICEYLGITYQDRAIASLPFHYSYGLSILHTHLIAGASIVLTSQSIIQEEFWKVFDRYKCTSLAGVPYTYQLLDRLGLDNIPCTSLRTLTQAGGKLSPALIIKFHNLMQKRHGRFFTMYGQTEATARIAYLPCKYLPEKAGAIGIPIPGGKIQLFKGDREITNTFCEGELVYTGPNVMLGYAYKSDDLCLGDQMHGVLKTGDIGFFDDEGVYYISGRMSRFSKIYGKRINLDDFEKAISHFGSIIVTSNDTVIKLYYESTSQIDTSACTSFLVSTYHLALSSFEWIELAHFPLTASGKIDYTKL